MPRLTPKRLTISAAVVVLGLALVVTAGIASGNKSRLLKGTPRADVLKGTEGADLIYGLSGADRIVAYAGDDVVYGGPGSDSIETGRGDDIVFAKDGAIDVVLCGAGRDTVHRDATDKVAGDCEITTQSSGTDVNSPSLGNGRPVRLTIHTLGSGTVTSTPAGINCGRHCRVNMPSGTVVKLVATPSGKAQFMGWGVRCRGRATTCVTTMRSDTWVRAQFSTASTSTPPPPGPPPPPPPPSPPPPPPPPPPASGNNVILVNQTWTCTGPVNIDLVRVTMQSGGDAVHLRENCSGRIGRLEVSTWTADGLKVNAPSPAAHDLVVEGGFIRCFGNNGGHQDGIQAMGGSRITFRNLEINCSTNPNAQLFIAASNGGQPTDIVCESCILGAGAAQTLFIATSTRSGARNTVVCEGRFNDIRIEGAASPINSGNVVIPSTDSRCRP